MARVINSSELDAIAYDESEGLWLYNALDCCVTFEVLEALKPQLDKYSSLTYSFSRAIQAPLLEMMLRGVLVDDRQRARMEGEYLSKFRRLEEILNLYGHAIWGKPINARSPLQLKELFYDWMNLPKVYKYVKGQRKLTTDRDALEKLESYFHARPVIRCILSIREFGKVLQVLRKGVDSDGRIRTSYNIGGTETGRLSSSENAFRTGDNLQNWADDLRIILCADPGKKLGYIDLATAESLAVAYLANDENYIKACESGDVHTSVAKLVWPELPWTGDAKRDREMAERPYYRWFDRRFMCKKGGHGCLTEDHEVLTRDGWVSIENKPREILCWNDGVSMFLPVTQWTEHNYTGVLQEFEGNSISALMTHDHRVPYRSDNKSLVKESPAEAGPKKFMPLGEGFIGGDIIAPARLIAAFMSDGHQKSTNVMEFHFKKERKKERLKHLCETYSFSFTEIGDRIRVRGCLPKKAGAFMFNWKKDCLLDFLDEYRFWDGHTTNTAVTLFSVDLEHLRWIKTLGRICGIGGNIQKPYISGYGSTVYHLQQNNRKWASGNCMRHRTQLANNTPVFCPTVKPGWFYTRRNDKIFVTGNTNYYGKAFTLAKHMHTEEAPVQEFQDLYFRRFPGIPRWHQRCAQELQLNGFSITPFGRRRFFLGRHWEDETLREFIANTPQSIVADVMNLGILRIWEANFCKVLMNWHDAVVIQYPEEDEAEIIPRAISLMAVDVPIGERILRIPLDAMTGWNLKKADTNNLDGLKKFSEQDSRKRTALPALTSTNLLSRIVS